jgi:hypothetical protein
MAAKPRKSWIGPQAIKQSLIVRLKLHTSFETRTNPIWRGCCSFMLCEGSRTHCTHGGGNLKPENTLYKKACFGGIGRFAFTDMHYSPCKFCSCIVESKSIFYMQAWGVVPNLRFLKFTIGRWNLFATLLFEVAEIPWFPSGLAAAVEPP